MSTLSQKKVFFFFLPPINKNHIFVEKLLTIFCILPLVASTFFVKALSCQKFLPKKWKFSFDFVWKTNKKNKKFVLSSSFLKNIFYLRVTYHAMKKKMFLRNEEVKTNFLFVFQTKSNENFHFFGRNFWHDKALTKNVEATRGKIQNIVNSFSTNMWFLLIGGKKKKKFFLRESTQKNFWVFLSFFRQKFLEEVWVPVLGRLGESQKNNFFLSLFFFE